MIRRMETSDINQVMKIWLEVNIESHSFISRNYWISHFQLVQNQLLQADVLVYEQNKQIQGFVGMMNEYLAGIFVDKDFRSRGIGKELLDCIKNNYATFSLNVYQKNIRAVNFYLREGLVLVSKELDEDTSEVDYTMVWNKNKAYS